VVRNASGVLVINQSVGIRISILQGSSTGAVVYKETYSPTPQTNANGLVSIEIGSGIPVTGTFSSLDWSTGSYFLKTETDPTGGTNYTIVGTSQLLSVPYSLYALTAGSSSNAVKITGDQTIAGHKTFSGTTTVANPVNPTDAANKDYVDALMKRISELENKPGVMKDYDGNLYTTVKIGNQVWMAENLKVTRFRNGDPIAHGTGSTEWGNLTTGAYADYNNSVSNSDTYGRLYNWFSVDDARNLCPTGWHVPSEGEWTTMITYLGGESVVVGKIKEAGTTHWLSPNTAATNQSAFTALPGGFLNGVGSFSSLGLQGWWWSSTTITGVENHARLYMAENSYVRSFKYEDSKQSGLSVRCIQGELNSPVTITTNVSGITSTEATSGGYVTHDGNSPVTARGVCWNTSANPTIENSKTTDGSGKGTFASLLTGLTPNTTYYVRSYATNSLGTGYGNEFIITTFSGSVNDIDGNVYKTKDIGTQLWMAENLRTTRYNNGDSIGTTPLRLNIMNETAPKYQWGRSEKSLTGRFYTWYAIMDTRTVCPTGWHVPSDIEWKTLEMSLGMTQMQADSVWTRGTNQGSQLKNTTGWDFGVHSGKEGTGTNSSGFSAIAVGYRDPFGSFNAAGMICHFWTSSETSATEVWIRSLVNEDMKVSRSSGTKMGGISVRCIKD
jgi:uncharacterized protein (TIGR02145 family)